MKHAITLIATLLLVLPIATHAAPRTFCNPLNPDYGWSAKGFRHGADPVIVLFKDRYYLFTTDALPGYRVSDDLLIWKNILFPPELIPLMADNDRGACCASALASDGKTMYFIRMDRRKDQMTIPPSARSLSHPAAVRSRPSPKTNFKKS
jgi:hypothetical protein